MMALYFEMLPVLQNAVYKSTVKGRDNIYDFFMSLPNVYPKQNPFIFTSSIKMMNMMEYLKDVQLPWVNLNNHSNLYDLSIMMVADFQSFDALKQAQLILSSLVSLNT